MIFPHSRADSFAPRDFTSANSKNIRCAALDRPHNHTARRIAVLGNPASPKTRCNPRGNTPHAKRANRATVKSKVNNATWSATNPTHVAYVSSQAEDTKCLRSVSVGGLYTIPRLVVEFDDIGPAFETAQDLSAGDGLLVEDDEVAVILF